MYSFNNSSCINQVLDHIYLFDEIIEIDVGQNFYKIIKNYLFY